MTDLEQVLLFAIAALLMIYFRELRISTEKTDIIYHLSRIIAGVADKEIAVRRNPKDTIEVIDMEKNT